MNSPKSLEASQWAIIKFLLKLVVRVSPPPQAKPCRQVSYEQLGTGLSAYFSLIKESRAKFSAMSRVRSRVHAVHVCMRQLYYRGDEHGMPFRNIIFFRQPCGVTRPDTLIYAQKASNRRFVNKNRIIKNRKFGYFYRTSNLSCSLDKTLRIMSILGTSRKLTQEPIMQLSLHLSFTSKLLKRKLKHHNERKVRHTIVTV